jgi:hypothetical protein
VNMRRYCCSSFSLNSLNYTAAVFHLIQAAIVLGIIQHLNRSMENEKYGLNNGVFKLTKSSFIITSKESNQKTNTDEMMAIGRESKCSLPPIDIYNTSDISAWVDKRATAAKKTPINSQDILGFSVAFDYFSAPNGHSVIAVQRKDVFMFEDKYFVVPQTFHVGDLDIRYIIFSFFLFSGLFQLADGFMGAYTQYSGLTLCKPRLLRFVEYSFSASIMILAIGVETGINDIYALCGIFTLIFTTNILGLIAEIFCFMAEGLTLNGNDLSKIEQLLPVSIAWLWLIPHFLGWITCILAYAPLLDSYLQSTRCSDRGPPGFVHVIVFLEFVLFSSFGFVQLYSLYFRTQIIVYHPERYLSGSIPPANGRIGAYSSLIVRGRPPQHDDIDDTVQVDQYRGKASISEQADYMYILLSFIAKTLLAWLILSPALMSNT